MGPVFYLEIRLKTILIQVPRKSTAIQALHSDVGKLGKASGKWWYFC